MTHTLKKLRMMTDAELAELADNGLMNIVCEQDDLPTLRYLAEERGLPVERMGLNPDAPSHTGRTPRDIATEQNFTALLNYLDSRCKP